MLRPAVSGGYGTWTHGFNVLSHWWKMFVGQKSSCVGHRAGNKPCQTTVSGADSSVVMGREGRAFPVPSILPKQTSRGLTFQVHHLQSWPGGSLPRNIGTWIFLWVSREKVAGEALVSRGISLEVITDIFKLYLFIYLFIYFCLCRVFIAPHGLFLVVASRGYSQFCSGAGFSLWWLCLLQSIGSRLTGFSSYSMRAQ